ncbi:MAG: ribonuclease, Rne/Rng family domain protein [Herminiimonas sp.]|nr:ribonuclease, Rne/Rng family domain protein [Herminiimonas sp.]MDB5853130.1 ribonuclease, Rne/Rng family domain protein [Herminiimonas sp.]
MKRMLFNATQQEELRVAIVDGQKLIDIDIETTGREQRKSNIYKGVITRIEPSLEACFINYGEERHGFLPFKEVARTYFREGVDVRTASVREALREGQEIMVQVEKEERGNKGAALTSFISLAGRYLVLMPNNPRGGGVSRRVEGEDRQELRETMDRLDLPTGMSVIARTAGIGRNVDELQWDLNYLMQLWRAIEGAGQSSTGAFLIYQESSLVIRAIRDYFHPDIGEILIDTDDIYEQAQQFMSHVMPDMVHRVKRYRDDVPLFSRFQIEHQIETAYSRTVPLPSGGAIVIDHTEALVSVDVNSARATRGADIETTAFNTNCEAAEEVARQLRLRDLGGLIVIDFIDMENARNQREVETRLKDALHYDRARVQMGKISRFGLMELSRQRLRPSLSEGSHVTCPRCNGTGHIRDTESSALQVLRIIQEEAMKENSASIHVQAPVDVAAFLLNEKRGEILKIETRHRVSVILIPNKHLETPHYKLERIKHDDPRLEDVQASYAMAEQADTDIGYSKGQKEEGRPRQEAVVKSITPDQPAPIVDRTPVAPPVVAAPPSSSEEGFFTRLFGLFRKKPVEPAAQVAPVAAEKPQQSRDRGDRNARGGQRGRGRGKNGRDRSEELEGAKVEGKVEARDDAQKAAQPVLAQQGRPPRPPREPRESRESREAREAREGREPREPREPKEPREARDATEPREANDTRRERGAERSNDRGDRQRPPREPRKEVAAQAVDELPLKDAALAAGGLNPDDLIEAEAAVDLEMAGMEEGGTVTADGEQPRRRRRRGGRNRNRRERETTEGAELSEGGQTASELDAADDDADANGNIVPVKEEASVAGPRETMASPMAQAPAAESSKAWWEVPASDAGANVASEADAVSSETLNRNAAEKEADTAPTFEQASGVRVESGFDQAPAADAEATVATASVTSAPESPLMPIVAPPAAVQAAAEPVPAEAHAPSPAPAERAEAAAPAQSAPAAPVAPSAPQAPAAPVRATAQASQPVTSAPMPVADLREMLGQAGLTLATTDPAKLRAAQEAAATVQPAPRIVRERKPAATIPTEPLVQVETRSGGNSASL